MKKIFYTSLIVLAIMGIIFTMAIPVKKTILKDKLRGGLKEALRESPITLVYNDNLVNSITTNTYYLTIDLGNVLNNTDIDITGEGGEGVKIRIKLDTWVPADQLGSNIYEVTNQCYLKKLTLKCPDLNDEVKVYHSAKEKIDKIICRLEDGDDSFTNVSAPNYIKRSVFGGPGNDTIHGGKDDILNGEDGDDYIIGSIGNDIISGGAGNDELRGLSGTDIVFGEPGDDKIYGGTDDDFLSGAEGEDEIHDILWPGIDTINGGPGPDVIYADSSDTIISDDEDTISYTTPS